MKKYVYYRDWSELPLLMTLGQCAVVLDYTYEKVRLLVNSGALPATKIGGQWRVEKAALKKMFEGSSVA